jgi:hypothetical protein
MHSFRRKSLTQAADGKDIMKNFYIPVYQFYLYAQLIFLQLWLQLGKSIYFYPMLGLNCLMMVWQLVFQPYRQKVDNLRIFLNLVTVLAFQITILLKEKQLITSKGPT